MYGGFHVQVNTDDGGVGLGGSVDDGQGRFCFMGFGHLGNSDFTLCDNSPCLPGGNPWATLLGAEDVGCGSCSTTAEPTTWSAIKAMFR